MPWYVCIHGRDACACATRRALRGRGQSRDNKMFLMLQAVKSERKPRRASVSVVLKACKYKKR